MRKVLSSLSYREAIEDRRLDLPGLFTEAAKVGLAEIEAWGMHFPTINDVFLNELALCRRRTGVKVGCISLSPDFGYPDAAERAQQVKDVVVWLETARRLDAGMVRLSVGRVWEGIALNQTRQWVIECLERLVVESAGRDRALVVEDWDKVFDSARELLEAMEGVRPAGDVREAGGGDWGLARMRFDDHGLELNEEMRTRLKGLPADVTLSLEYIGSGDPSPALAQAVKVLQRMGY